MIVSAIEASSKELITTIVKENQETRATIRKENIETREILPKIEEEFQKMLVETENNQACENPTLERMNIQNRLQVYLLIKLKHNSTYIKLI